MGTMPTQSPPSLVQTIDDVDLATVRGGFDIGSLMSSAVPLIGGITGLIGAFKSKKGAQPDAPVGSETAGAASAAAAPQSAALPSSDAGAAASASQGAGSASGAGGIPGISISVSINGVQQV